MKFCVNFETLFFSKWKLRLEPANKYSVVCSTTLLIQHETFMFYTHFQQKVFFTYSGRANFFCLWKLFYCGINCPFSKAHWFFRLILNRNIFCTMNWECLCFHYFDNRIFFNRFINLSFQLILFSTENWSTLVWCNGTLCLIFRSPLCYDLKMRLLAILC